SLFFFQAEDGIRDRNVTGVQTCALPILYPCISPSCSLYLHRISCHPGKNLLDLPLNSVFCGFLSLPASISGPVVLYVKSIVHIRSEERRVGKECSSLC